MKKTYCDGCGDFMYDEHPGIDYSWSPAYTVRPMNQSPHIFCSRECAVKYMDTLGAVRDHMTRKVPLRSTMEGMRKPHEAMAHAAELMKCAAVILEHETTLTISDELYESADELQKIADMIRRITLPEWMTIYTTANSLERAIEELAPAPLRFNAQGEAVYSLDTLVRIEDELGESR